ncbi:hypothetical protein Tco_1216324, partial [Tanacetum coccineum]
FHIAQHVIPANQLVPQYKLIRRCNNYAMLQSIPCSPECKIVGLILLDHCLSHALTSTADVPAVDTLHLPVETLENPFVVPANIHTIEAFMNRVGYQGVVDKKKEVLQYPRFIKLIVAYLMKKSPNIPKRLEEDYHSIKDDVPLIREMNDFKEYEMVFMKVDVLMNQLQPVVSTQGTHRITPSAHRSPTISSSPLKIVEKDDDDSKDRIEPESHKDNPKVVVDDDDKEREQKDDEMGRALRRMCMHQGSMIQDIETNLKPCIVNTIIEDRDAFRSEVPAFISKEFKAHALAIIEELFKNHVQYNVIHVHPTITTSTETESSANLQYQLYLKMKRDLQDRADDIALVKRSKTSKRSKSARDSLSKHSRKDSTTYVSKQQSQHQEWDAWEEENVVDENEVISEDVTPELIAEFQNIDKRVPTIFDHARIKATLRDSLSNLSRNAEDMEIPEKKYILLLYKIHTEEFPKPDLEEKLNRWVRKEFKTFIEDARLSIQHWKDSWHKKVNLTARTLTFLGIEEHAPYTIVDEPQMGLIYLNNKDEKRVMYLEEIAKFYDATLEKVLNEVPETGHQCLQVETVRYAQWQSRFMRYIDTRPNCKELKQCIYDGPYVMTKILVPGKPTTATEEAVPAHTITKTYKNTTPKKHAYFDAEAEAIQFILTGIGDDIYSTINACTTTKEIWTAIERLDKESIELYYSRFYKMMNEMVRNKLEVATMQLQKNLALVAKYIKNIYSKPTNNNFKTSSNTRNKNIDTTLRYGNDINTRQFMNQRTMTVVEAREIVGNQAEKGVPLSAEQGDWLDDTDEEPDEQELEAHYLFIAKIQEVLIVESGPTFDTKPLEKVDSNTTPDSSDVCINDFEDDQEDERSNDIHDRCKSALHNQDIELEKYKKYKDCQIEKEELERKLQASVDRLAQQKLQTVEALKLQAYETFEYKEKNTDAFGAGALEVFTRHWVYFREEYSRSDKSFFLFSVFYKALYPIVGVRVLGYYGNDDLLIEVVLDVNCENVEDRLIGHSSEKKRELGGIDVVKDCQSYALSIRYQQSTTQVGLPALHDTNAYGRVDGLDTHLLVVIGEVNKALVRMKSLLMLFGITTILIDVNASQSKLVLLENFNENYSKPGEFELKRMRIEQYIQIIDYALWEVIETGATMPKTQMVEGVMKVMLITTAEEKALRRLEVKASKLLEAIEKRFGGNEATKKTQRNLLKQQYENFTALSSEMLDQTFDRLQKLWNTHAVVWRNKSDLDTMSMDDLYNNLKVYEPEVKGISSSSSSTHNMAFEGSLLLKAMRLLVLIVPKTKWNVTTTTIGDIFAKGVKLQEIKTTRRKAQERVLEKYNAVPPPYTENFMPPTPDLSFIGLDEFVNKPVVENGKSDKEVSEIVRKNDDVPIVEEWVSNSEEENVSQSKTEKKIVKLSIAKIEFVKPKQQEKTARKIVKQVKKHKQNTHSPRGNQRKYDVSMTRKQF